MARLRTATAVLAVGLALTAVGPAAAQDAEKPNILVIWGDDIGQTNLSTYSFGLMGYETPNIDRIANEGLFFTDYYAEQSCTAGRSTFITGQSTLRTGLSKVGLPGADVGLQPDDVTIASALKDLGYATGQFGKNHLGDKDEFLPTNHGFDEFFGNLYHLNAEEEPENPDHPKDPAFRERFGPRGVLRASADGEVEDTGPLTKHRMETVDEEFIAAALDFMQRKTDEGMPWFTYVNTTRMHVNTHLKPASDGVTGLGLYPDGMVELDGYVGQLLQKVEDLAVADNTIVLFTTDNGAEVMTWPDGGTTPFRGEKATNWEGGFRVPMLIRWPGVIEPGQIINDMAAHEDLIPTFAAAACESDLVEKVLAGYQAGEKTFKVHLDGYNLMPFLSGDEEASPRNSFIYWSDDGDLMAIRYDHWKAIFKEQENTGLDVWRRDFTDLRVPLLINLKSDPYERGPESIEYDTWVFERAFILVPMQAFAANWLSSFQEFPPRQKPASFNLDEVMLQMSTMQSKQ
jgi:arylsulfatase